MSANHFYGYQRRVLRVLLGWGVGNTIAGLPLALSPSPFWRQFGFQAVSWGAIDALLAIFGLTGAAGKAARLATGALDEGDARADARAFRRVLLINAALDVGYVAAGAATIRLNPGRPDRAGMGAGIALQGLFLLFYDAALARDVAGRFLDEPTAGGES